MACLATHSDTPAGGRKTGMSNAIREETLEAPPAVSFPPVGAEREEQAEERRQVDLAV